MSFSAYKKIFLHKKRNSPPKDITTQIYRNKQFVGPVEAEEDIYIQHCEENEMYLDLYHYLQPRLQQKTGVRDSHIMSFYECVNGMAEHFLKRVYEEPVITHSTLEEGRIVHENGYSDLEHVVVLAYAYQQFGQKKEFQELKSKIESVYGPIGLLREGNEQPAQWLKVTNSPSRELSIEELSKLLRSIFEIRRMEKSKQAIFPEMYQKLLEAVPFSKQTADSWYQYAVALDQSGEYYEAWNLLERLVFLAPSDYRFLLSWVIAGQNWEKELIQKAFREPSPDLLPIVNETQLRLQQWTWTSDNLLLSRFLCLLSADRIHEVHDLAAHWLDLFPYRRSTYECLDWFVDVTGDSEIASLTDKRREKALKEKPYLYLLRPDEDVDTKGYAA